MKKMISLILAAALVVTLLGLYGCQKAGQEVTEPTAATEATEAATATVETTVPEAAENTEPQTDGSTDEEKAGSTDGNNAQGPEPTGSGQETGDGGSGQKPDNGPSAGDHDGSAGDPPATNPPATEPPATQPPATEPPATQPPATEPPATEPPATQPPATEPPATEPPATQPPATEPPATQPPATEAPAPTEHTHSYTVSSTIPASCTSEGSNTYTCSCGDSYTETIPMTNHNWVHQHQDEVKHEDCYIVCRCGARFYSTSEWIAHTKNYDAVEALTNHGGYAEGSSWVIDTPAKDWDQCSICGATK